MRRLRPLDKALVLILVPLWAAFLALHVVESARTGLAKPPFFVTRPAPGEYPQIDGIYVGRRAAADRAGVRLGDRLLRVGDRDARGLGHAGVEALLLDHGAGDLRVPIVYERAGVRRSAFVPLVTARVPGGLVPTIFVSGLVAVMILLRAPSVRQGRQAFVAIMLWLCLVSDFGGGPALQTHVWKIVQPLLSMIAVPLAVRWACDFPDAPPGRPGVLRHWPWLLAPAHGIARLSYRIGGPIPPEFASAAVSLVDGASVIVFLVALTVSYRRADRLGRRQIKWALYGFYFGLAPFGLTSVLASLPGLAEWHAVLWAISMLFTVCCSLGVLAAIAFYHLFDIDRLISGTASYSILAVAVLAGIFALIPRLAEAAGTAVGVDPPSAQLVLSVALAAIAVPVHRSLRPRIDRLFFPERHTLGEGIERLLGELSTKRDPRELTALAGEHLDALLRPESCVVYGRAGEAFSPVFARGRAVPPAFEGNSPLVTTVHNHSGPLVSERFTRRGGMAKLSLFDRAALDTLGVAVVVPVRRRGELVAFFCLGAKRSGDIYTSTDLTLLAAVADRVSMQLDRVEDAQMLREARAMQEELRRYVPGAVAKGLESGEGLEPRERAVSVLFVDIRGYTSYSESRRAEEIFSTINRYTTTVSSLVEKFGGSVLEFNGDGMMAVFGAPQALPDKERAAVRAGQEIVSKVESLGQSAGEPSGISVGVGIATGAVFVGSIQSVDRLIWTALGNTSNLAARLQSLTRDLDAAMVIDLATWRAAGDAAHDFERREAVPIRGRQHREDVYVLLLGSPMSP